VDGARWPLRSSKPLYLVKSGVGGFDSLALPPAMLVASFDLVAALRHVFTLLVRPL
jgi:hypothetical protein